MEFPLAAQTVYFLYSLLFGVILSVMYDFVRIMRFCSINRKWQIILSDIVYFIICSFLTVLFALPFNKGGVRGFVLFGESLGFLTYRFTIGQVLAPFYCTLIGFFTKIMQKSCKILRLFFNKLLKACILVVYNISVKIHKVQNIVLRKNGKKREQKS